jgi:hypothetical protein
MDRTLVRNLQQSQFLHIGQRPREMNVPLDAVEHAFPGLAIGAIGGVNFRVPQLDGDVFERPGFSPSVHRHSHRSTRAERGKQQIVRRWPCIRAPHGNRLVRVKPVRPRVNLLREPRGTAANDYASCFAFFHAHHRVEERSIFVTPMAAASGIGSFGSAIVSAPYSRRGSPVWKSPVGMLRTLTHSLKENYSNSRESVFIRSQMRGLPRHRSTVARDD